MGEYKAIQVMNVRPATEKLRKPPAFGQGSISWACGHGKHGGCSKLTCPCTCHREAHK